MARTGQGKRERMLITDECRTHCSVVVRGMGFGKIISQVRLTRTPEDDIVTVGYSITYPVISHVNRLGTLEADGLVGNTVRGGVIGDYWGCVLRVTKVF